MSSATAFESNEISSKAQTSCGAMDVAISTFFSTFTVAPFSSDVQTAPLATSVTSASVAMFEIVYSSLALVVPFQT